MRSRRVWCYGVQIPRLTLLYKGTSLSLFVILGKIIIGMILETEQIKGVKVILVEETDDDEAASRDIWPAGEPDAEDKDENTSF